MYKWNLLAFEIQRDAYFHLKELLGYLSERITFVKTNSLP